MSIRTLPLAFFKHCVRRPTYLDVLPVDVIRHFILPCLGWEDRIHLNMLTPPGDRTPPNKIPKDRIIAHQLCTSAKKLSSKVTAATTPPRRESAVRRTEALLNVFRSLNASPDVALMFQHSSVFRATVINKLTEFADPEALARITRVVQRNEMRQLIDALMTKVAAHPFVRPVSSKQWLRAVVTQNGNCVYSEWE